jgi:TolA-binding protein
MSGDGESDGGAQQHIRVGETAAGDRVALPVEQVLTGRGFLTGKSGAGKSNTASVVVEELLEAGFPVLIVDTDGEYYGLKEEYELLHAGADAECDVRVEPEHAEKLATLALERNVPIILDVSGFLDAAKADALIRETARHLFAREKKLKKPFLLVVEEIHEYVPEGAGMGETGQMLIKVGKRGRKHGLGIVGISQRPADVKKDFITQANWLVWHRLTWENDTKVVSRIVGGEYGEAVPDLDDGEAFVQTDWTDDAVRRVSFKRKRTFDAGATPGLEDFERPDLKSVSETLVEDLAEITEAEERRESRIEELEAELDAREARIEELETELERARDVSRAAERIADTVASASGDGGGGGGDADRLAIKRETVERLQSERDDLERELDSARRRIARLEGGDDAEVQAPATPATAVDAADGAADADAEADQSTLGDAALDAAGDAVADARTDDAADSVADARPTAENGSESPASTADEATAADPSDDERTTAEPEPVTTSDVGDGDAAVEAFQEQLRRTGERLLAAEGDDPAAHLAAEPVRERIDAARRESLCSRGQTRLVVAALRRDAPLSETALADRVGADRGDVQGLLTAMGSRDLVTRDGDGWRLDRPALADLAGQS